MNPPQTIFLGHPLVLILHSPNWAGKISTTYTLNASIESSPARHEERRPLHEALRLSLNCTFTLDTPEADTLQRTLDSTLDQLIGIPLPMDALPPQYFHERTHNAEFSISYDPRTLDYTIHQTSTLTTETLGTITHPLIAPLLVARLNKRPETQALTDIHSNLTLELIENSPWDARITPMPHTWDNLWTPELIAEAKKNAIQSDATPASSTFGSTSDLENWFPLQLTPDWTTPPTEGTDTLLKYTAAGNGRLSPTENQESGIRTWQSAFYTLENRAQILTLLNHFHARSAATHSFVAKWHLHPRPEISPSSPAETPLIARRVRYTGDSITLQWLSTNAASTTLKFTTLPHEPSPRSNNPKTTGATTETPTLPTTAHLYSLTLQLPAFAQNQNIGGTTTTWRLTDYERPLAAPTGTFTPAPIEHDKITHTANLEDDTLKLTTYLPSATNSTAQDTPENSPLLLIVRGHPPAPLLLKIELATLTTNGTTTDIQTLFSGEITKVELLGKKLTASASTLGALSEVKLPRFLVQGNCNHDFCGPHCTLNSADYTHTGTLIGKNINRVAIRLDANPTFPSLPFLGTYDPWMRAALHAGSALNYETRAVQSSNQDANGNTYLVLDDAPWFTKIGDPIILRRHCGGTWKECRYLFNNRLNFGGHPHIQAENPSIPRRDQTIAGGKK